MAKKAERQKAIKRLNLSDHTRDINIRRYNYNKFNNQLAMQWTLIQTNGG